MLNESKLPFDDHSGRVFLNLLLVDMFDAFQQHPNGGPGFEVSKWREKIIERFSTEQPKDAVPAADRLRQFVDEGEYEGTEAEFNHDILTLCDTAYTVKQANGDIERALTLSEKRLVLCTLHREWCPYTDEESAIIAKLEAECDEDK